MSKQKQKDAEKQLLLGELLRVQHEHDKSNPSFKMVREINTFLKDSKEQGFTDMSQLNQMAAHQIANQAIHYEDKGILDIISHIKTAGGNNYGNTLYAQDLIRKVSTQIDTKKDRDEERRWRREDRKQVELKKAFGLKIGEYYNFRDNEDQRPQGWNQNEAFNNLRSDLYKVGLIDAAKALEDRKHTLGEREAKDSLMTFDEFKELNPDVRLKLMRMAQTPSELYDWGLKNRPFEPSLLTYLLQGADKIKEHVSLRPYTTARAGFKAFLGNFARQKIKELIPSFDRDPTLLKPKAYEALVQGFLLEWEQKVEELYLEIARMDGEGYSRNFDNWHPDQKANFASALSMTDYSNAEKTPDDLADIYRRGETTLSDLMDVHLKGNSSYMSTDKALVGKKVRNFYTKITGEDPDGKLYAKDLLIYLDRANIKLKNASKTWNDSAFEQLIEDELGIDPDDEMSAGDRQAIKDFVGTLYDEITDLMIQERMGK